VYLNVALSTADQPFLKTACKFIKLRSHYNQTSLIQITVIFWAILSHNCRHIYCLWGTFCIGLFLKTFLLRFYLIYEPTQESLWWSYDKKLSLHSWLHLILELQSSNKLDFIYPSVNTITICFDSSLEFLFFSVSFSQQILTQKYSFR